jgi:glycosyltransferase involved in cell wall biosynthesis
MYRLGKQRPLEPRQARGPLRLLFAVTSLPVGGAETLLKNLIRRLDPDRFAAEICCLKEPGSLGAVLAEEFPLHSRLLRHKYDSLVVARMASLMRERQIDAVITVGAGDKMFWGRLAAAWTGVPVVLSAIHSTGWPDRIERVNRLLTPLTDAFIAVAASHGRYLVDVERLPKNKVIVIPNGVDVRRFQFSPSSRRAIRAELGIDAPAPVVGIVAALRPEKNVGLFLRAARRVSERVPAARFLIVGEGPKRQDLQQQAARAGLQQRVHFLGCRHDVPELLSAMDVFALTSQNEANPVSILEAMACQIPVAATNVGSVSETVQPGITGWLIDPDDDAATAAAWLRLLDDPATARRMGRQGREQVAAHWSVTQMVAGYEDLIQQIYRGKCLHTDDRRDAPLPLAETTR